MCATFGKMCATFGKKGPKCVLPLVKSGRNYLRCCHLFPFKDILKIYLIGEHLFFRSVFSSGKMETKDVIYWLLSVVITIHFRIFINT